MPQHKGILQPRLDEPKQNKAIIVHGSERALLGMSRDYRDQELARIQLEREKARRPTKPLQAIVHLLTRGGKRNARQAEIDAEVAKLDLKCRAFEAAVQAVLATEGEKTKRVEALFGAIASMAPANQIAALEIITETGFREESSTALPNISMPHLWG